MNRIVFRADASTTIGSGHITRCLSLAEELRKKGAEILFICRELPGNMCTLVESRGFEVKRLSPPSSEATVLLDEDNPPYANWLCVKWTQDAAETTTAITEPIDWLVVDHYALDFRWEKTVRAFAKRILVIDDLADRVHDCDLLLDQNYYENPEDRYNGLVPRASRMLLGSRYALLRDEFLRARQQLAPRTGKMERILLFFGASDANNDTLKALQGIHGLTEKGIAVDVVSGINHPCRQSVKNFAANLPKVYCHDYVNNMAELMSAADLYLGAAGTTTWERCCLGLPSLVISSARNQIEPIRSLERTGAVRYLGESANTSAAEVTSALADIMNNPSALATMSSTAEMLVDGLGTRRCVAAMFNEREMTDEQ